MKVLTVVYSIGSGGTERAAVNYSIAYKNFGIDSRVWVLGEGHERKASLDNYKVPVYLDVLSDHHSNYLLLAQWKPDIIHIHTINESISKILTKFKEDGSKVVETNVFSRPRYEKEYRIIDISFQLSYWGVWKYHKWMKFEKKQPFNLRLPYLINDKDFYNNNDKSDQLRVNFNIPHDAVIAGRVGQAHVSKWDRRIFDVVTEAIKRKNNLYFVFVGMPDQFQKEYNGLPLQIKNKIKLIKFLDGDRKLSEFYKSLDFFVHISSIGESFGYVLAESLLCGCPVITLVTPLKDNAQYEVVGYKTGGKCAKSIGEFVDFLLCYADYKYAYSKENLREDVISRFSEEAQIPSLIETFRQLIDNDQMSLNNKRLEAVKLSEMIVRKQIKEYGFKGIFLKIVLNIVHHPFVYKLLH